MRMQLETRFYFNDAIFVKSWWCWWCWCCSYWWCYWRLCFGEKWKVYDYGRNHDVNDDDNCDAKDVYLLLRFFVVNECCRGCVFFNRIQDTIVIARARGCFSLLRRFPTSGSRFLSPLDSTACLTVTIFRYFISQSCLLQSSIFKLDAQHGISSLENRLIQLISWNNKFSLQ